MAVPIEYEACPYCSSKNVLKLDRGSRIVIKCGNIDECGNVIDSFPKETSSE